MNTDKFRQELYRTLEDAGLWANSTGNKEIAEKCKKMLDECARKDGALGELVMDANRFKYVESITRSWTGATNTYYEMMSVRAEGGNFSDSIDAAIVRRINNAR